MKFLSSLTLALFAAFAAMANEPTPEEIRQQNQYVEYRLMQGEIYRIYVKMNDGVTTIQFPSKITEIAGKNISLDGKGTDFQIAAQPGSYYFSVSALKPGVSTTLTVTYNRRLYILYLIQSDKEAYASVVFGKNSGSRNFADNVVSRTPTVTPARLVSLIDMAKKFDVLKDTHPDSLAGVERTLFQNRYRCGKYDICLDEAIRFDEEDTVIFKLRLVNLTENLLSITRIENGTLPLRRDAEMIGDIFHEALSHVDRRAAEHEIRVELEDDMLMANMDARLIVQVIINIVNNAVKYTPEGSDICLSAKKENSMVRIEIADNGPGISDEAKQRLFDMFYTVNTGSAGADSRRGLGLGLSLCKSIVEAHGGSITVHDNQPHGSVFSFTLPLEEVKIQNV